MNALTSLILLSAAVLKFLAVVKGDPILEKYDPLLHMQFRDVLLGVGFCEALVVVLLWSNVQNVWKGLSLSLLSSAFLVYRIFSVITPDLKYCACLGSLELFASWPLFQELLLTLVSLYLLHNGWILMRK